MAKLSVSSLKRLIGEVDSYGLSRTKTESIRMLAAAELARREGTDQVSEFHYWIRKGDQILTELLSEMRLLRAATADTADMISRESVMDILSAMRIDSPGNDHEKGQNWCADSVMKQIATLPAVQNRSIKDILPLKVSP